MRGKKEWKMRVFHGISIYLIGPFPAWIDQRTEANLEIVVDGRSRERRKEKEYHSVRNK